VISSFPFFYFTGWQGIKIGALVMLCGYSLNYTLDWLHLDFTDPNIIPPALLLMMIMKKGAPFGTLLFGTTVHHDGWNVFSNENEKVEKAFLKFGGTLGYFYKGQTMVTASFQSAVGALSGTQNAVCGAWNGAIHKCKHAAVSTKQ
jgi:hypothetical protein